MAKSPWLLILCSLIIASKWHASASVNMKSDVFDWTYELDDTAPIVTTHEQASHIGHAHDGNVRVDRVNGTFMIVESTQKRQLATLAGEAAAFAESVYRGSVEGRNITALSEQAINAAAPDPDTGRAGAPHVGGAVHEPASNRSTTNSSMVNAVDKAAAMHTGCGFCWIHSNCKAAGSCGVWSSCHWFLCVEPAGPR